MEVHLMMACKEADLPCHSGARE